MSPYTDFLCLLFVTHTLVTVHNMHNSCIIYTNNLGLVTADCSNQSLRYVPSNLPPHINILNLNENRLLRIENGTFRKYQALHKLTINDNELKFLDQNAFEGLKSLEELYMSGNVLDLSTYSPALLEPIKNISALDISRNMKQTDVKIKIVYPDKAFGTLVNLEHFSFDLMPNPIFGKGFKSMQKLRKLVFNYCYLRKIENITFENFYFSVEHLEITGCRQFVETESGALEPFPHLKILDLSESYFHPIQAFQLLQSLQFRTMKVINFHHINDETIAKDYDYPYLLNVTRNMVKFLQTICVNDFDISENNIVDFENGSMFTFDRPECLHRLIISANRISFSLGYRLQSIKQFFATAKNLRTFDYSYIPLNILDFFYGSKQENLEDVAMRSDIVLPNSIEVLRLSHIMDKGVSKHWIVLPNSKMKSLDISYCDMNDQVVFHGKELGHLDVSGVDSRFVFGQIRLLSLPNLKNSTMRNSDFYFTYQLKENVFRYISNAERVDISYNFLWDLDENTFKNMTRLKHLQLSNNLFRTVPYAVTKIPKLHELDMRSNLLTSVDKQFRNFFDMLNSKHGFTLSLGNNAFVCDCTNSDFIWWLHTTNVTLDSDTYKCLLSQGIESDTHNVSINFHHHFASCNVGVWLRVGVALLVTFFAILLPVTVIYSLRWRITLFLYRRFRKVLEKGIGVNFKYDVFVFYPNDETSFIKNVLIAQIEDRWGLKMCIEHRDFGIGEPIADVMADCIAQSRHVIFLVTSSFKNEHWADYAVERAKYQHFAQNLQNIIVIIKGIGADELPRELASMWKDVSFIEWPHSEKDLQNVWNKLKLWLFLNHPN